MDYHVDTEEFIKRFGDLSRKRFLNRFRVPFLLIEMRGRKKSEGFLSFARTATKKQPTEAPIRLGGNVVDSLAVPLEKSGRNDFEEMITVGRDAKNDVIIPHKSVSKFHAVIRREAGDGRMTLGDVGSTNGTELNGELLEEGKAVSLDSGARIIFAGSVQASYFASEEFFDYLKLIQQLQKKG